MQFLPPKRQIEENVYFMAINANLRDVPLPSHIRYGSA